MGDFYRGNSILILRRRYRTVPSLRTGPGQEKKKRRVNEVGGTYRRSRVWSLYTTEGVPGKYSTRETLFLSSGFGQGVSSNKDSKRGRHQGYTV